MEGKQDEDGQTDRIGVGVGVTFHFPLSTFNFPLPLEMLVTARHLQPRESSRKKFYIVMMQELLEP